MCVAVVTEQLPYWSTAGGDISPAAAFFPHWARGGVSIEGGWRPGGPMLVSGRGDGGHPAPHWGGEGGGAAGFHLQRFTAAASRGRQRSSGGLLRKTTGEEGDQ